MITALRVAFGLLTIIPVGQPVALSRRSAGRVAACFPIVGLVLGVLAALLIKVARQWYRTFYVFLLPAALGIALLALLTRALHLDGLADVADGLGASREPKRSLEVMKQSTVGAFGVITVLFVVLLQVSALERCIQLHRGSLSIVLSVTVGRLAMLMACRHGIRSARAEGLGAMFAGTVSRRVVAVAVAVTLAAGAVEGKFDIDGGRTRLAMHAVLAAVIALVITELVRRLWCRRLGGITGDVLGALNELGTLLVLLLMAGQLPSSINAF